jgi:hypothetical protein
MFKDPELEQHLKTSSVIQNRSLVVAEWNLNIPENISRIGNYRYRPSENVEIADPLERSMYASLYNTYDDNDEGKFYTGATDADVVIDGGITDTGLPTTFLSSKEKESMLYSLEDCIGRFRPRSGINKLRYFEGAYSHHTNANMAQRPRYYMAHKDDQFKYWTSYRTESVDKNQDGVIDTTVERGVANKTINGRHYIEDAAPFIVYKNRVPANRLIVKMQTNVGTVDLGPFGATSGDFQDPLFGDINRTVPRTWAIQYLENNTWTTAISFSEDEVRNNGLPVIGSDGYVELAYGLIIPERYRSIFLDAGVYTSVGLLPDEAPTGAAYLVRATEQELGTYYIWIDGERESFVPTYNWYLAEESVNSTTSYVTDLTDPVIYYDVTDGKNKYREFQYISGMRIVADTMNKADSTFDLIEMSPRLVSDISDKTVEYSIKKAASDLGVSGMPVGQLLASTGSISIFDYDQAFVRTNTRSIIAPYIMQNTQIKFYEIIANVETTNAANELGGIFDYYVPIKTMYAEGFPEIDNSTRKVSLSLRDLYFYFEFLSAPQLLLTNVSLSYAISTLLDYIGFSNYTFKRLPNEPEAIIPFFFVPPDYTIAQVLQDLAISTQSAMFFDEYNNFVVMSKGFIMPSTEDRVTDMVLRGSADSYDSGILENKQGQLVNSVHVDSSELSNIIEITSQQNSVFNDGVIQYTTRHIKKTYGSIQQASLLDRDKSWVYEPAELWQVSPEENIRSKNDQTADQSNYVLSAIPLNSVLSDTVPSVANNVVINNTMDFGEGIYWLSRHNGYFYSNGEVIKFDAVQYSIPGLSASEYDDGSNVWISSTQEYQRYFSKLPFGGKIYPTGLVRIYSEPNYEVIEGITRLKNGPVAKHGRGQFGTKTVEHYSGLNPYWSNNENVRGCKMQSKYLFGSQEFSGAYDTLAAGVSPATATRTLRNGIIKNFLSGTYNKESDVNRMLSTQTGTIQSSALVFTGGSFFSTENPVDYVSYVYKPLTNNYKHFGTRLRLIGRQENSDIRTQTPSGVSPMYTVTGTKPDNSLSVGGSSAGLAVMVNPNTNVGYYFEIAALTESNIDDYEEANINDILFYKVVGSSSEAIPIKLWADYIGVTVDGGTFVGQSRMLNEEKPTVYDLSVEYQDIGNLRRFYLYVNNSLVQIVDDIDPLPVYNNMALFVRGGARAMFENVFAITKNYSQNTGTDINLPSNKIFATDGINLNDSFRKYALGGIIQGSYLSGISPSQPPEYDIYFEEFGTIMREASYFNVRYDMAYPALYARLAPTFNRLKGYTVSGFMAGAYGAEFLIFNATDTVLSLDSSSGNGLMIQGITFTQESNNELTVDSYFSKNSDFSNPEIRSGSLIVSPIKEEKRYFDIKTSRLTYGKNQFSLAAPYIQTQDDANDLMSWMIAKLMRPRSAVGARIFSMPIIQLGDILEIDYKNQDGDSQIASRSTRFVVYNIEHRRNSSGPEMNIFLSEVA